MNDDDLTKTAVDEEILDGLEVVEGELPTDSASESGAAVVMNLEGLIKGHIANIDRMDEEYRKYKEMLDDIFANDTTFQQHLEAAKEATRIKTATKQQILKQPQPADLNLKIKSLKSQMAETEEALSDYLSEFQRLSGLNEIEGEDGEMRQIVYVAKLVKKGRH